MAIAADTGVYISNTGAGTNVLTWNHTIAASPANPYLVVFVKNADGTGTTVSTVTVNGSSAGVALVDPFQAGSFGGTNSDNEIWHCVAPPTGVVSIAVTLTGTNAGLGAFSCLSQSYTGVHQTSPFDAFLTTIASGAVNNITLTGTVVATGCWLAGMGTVFNNKYAVSNNAQTVLFTGNEGVTYNFYAAHSGAAVGTGSQSLAFITNDSANTDLFIGIGYSFKPTSGVVSQSKDIASRADYQQSVNRGFASRTTRWTRDAVDLWNKHRSGIFVPRGFYPLLA